MSKHSDIIKYIEKIRLERKISIKKLTDEIITTRSYSRYLNDSQEMPFELMTKFLDRLEMPFFEFSIYVYNQNMYDHMNEIRFFELVKGGKYKEAERDFYPLIKEEKWGSAYAKKTIPMCVKMMEYHLDKTSKIDALAHMDLILELDKIVSGQILFADDIEAIYLYIRLCSDEKKDIISRYLLDMIYEDQIKVLTVTVEATTILMHLIILLCLTTKNEVNDSDDLHLKKVMHIILEYHIRAKLAAHDVEIFNILYQYIKSKNIENKYIVFHYMASILSSSDHFNDQLIGFTFEPSDIEQFIEVLNDTSFCKKSMYEGLIDYGII